MQKRLDHLLSLIKQRVKLHGIELSQEDKEILTRRARRIVEITKDLTDVTFMYTASYIVLFNDTTIDSANYYNDKEAEGIIYRLIYESIVAFCKNVRDEQIVNPSEEFILET